MSEYFAACGAPRGCWFDDAAANRAVAFIETFCVQSQGEWAGQPLRLSDWQKRIMRDVFGWKRADGTRQFRTVYIEIPRKNGKSTLSSAIALYLLFGDGEPGAQVYAAAGDRDQARIVFGEAKAMVEASPALAKRCRRFKDSMVVEATRSVFRVLSAEAYSKHGFNAHGIIFDELHVQPNRELYDVLRTSTGARRNPLLIMITTAGWDRTSLCWEQHERSLRTMADPLHDLEHYGVVYGAEEGDDWTSPAVWRKANPNLGTTIKEEYLHGLAREAETTPGLQNGFRRLHLDQWTAAETRWLDMGLWDDCREEDDPDLAGRVCYAGLDLASSNDMAALALVFPPLDDEEPWRVRVRYWVPGDNMQRRVEQTGTPYDVWARQGLLTATSGNVIDFEAIQLEILALGTRFRILEIAFDRWGAIQISQQLGEAGFTMVQFGQGFASMAPPMKEFSRLVALGQIAHDGNPILRWNVDNVQAEQDAAGNLKPSKRKSKGKIDGLVAALMALDRAQRNEAAPSRYSEGELAVL